MVAQSSPRIDEEDLRRAARIEEFRDPAVGIFDDVESVAVLARMRPRFFGGLETSGIDTHEEDPPFRKLPGQVADQVVVVVGVRTDRREKQDDDAVVGPFGFGERESPPLESRHSKLRRDSADLQPADHLGGREEESSGQSGRCAGGLTHGASERVAADFGGR